MNKLLLILALVSFNSYSQDYPDPPMYHPEDQVVDEYEIEQQRFENEERAREAQMLREMEPPVDHFDNSGDFGGY